MTQPPDLPRALAEAKAPASSSMLSSWINQTEQKVGSSGGRLSWLIASTVVVAVLQRALDLDGQPHFLLKGGILLQHRLPAASTRATKDVDGLVRGDIADFLDKLDDVLDEPWGPLSLRRTAVDVIETPTRVIKPRRFDVVLEMQGKTWRKVQVEIAPDEGGAGQDPEPFTAPPLAPVGLPDPVALVGLALRYQVAQKIHACSDLHGHRAPSTIGLATSWISCCCARSTRSGTTPWPYAPRSWTSSTRGHVTPGLSGAPCARGRARWSPTSTGRRTTSAQPLMLVCP